jgi:hypothetical protein
MGGGRARGDKETHVIVDGRIVTATISISRRVRREPDVLVDF